MNHSILDRIPGNDFPRLSLGLTGMQPLLVAFAGTPQVRGDRAIPGREWRYLQVPAKSGFRPDGR